MSIGESTPPTSNFYEIVEERVYRNEKLNRLMDGLPGLLQRGAVAVLKVARRNAWLQDKLKGNLISYNKRIIRGTNESLQMLGKRL